MASVNYFLKLDGITGDAADAKHKGFIDLESWSWGETQSGGQAGGGGGGAGKVAMQDLHVTARTSIASPKLMLACASGKHLKEARLVGVRAGRGQAEFLTVTLSDVLVSSYQAGGAEAGGDAPFDQVSLNFAKIVFEVRAQKADGSLDAPVRAGWHVKQNKPV